MNFDYYWRDYLGIIPQDAIVGGHDKNDNLTFIGQVLMDGPSLQVVRIYPDKPEVEACKHRYCKTTKNIKILCTRHKHKFKWIDGNASTLQTSAIGKHFVVGGSEDGHLLHIGRAMFENEMVVGKVCSFNVGQALMFFATNGWEKSFDSYQILTFEHEMPVQKEEKKYHHFFPKKPQAQNVSKH